MSTKFAAPKEYPKGDFSQREEEILDYWDRAKIFEKSVEKKAPRGDYVFYDGPPFGTGEPHYGHILSSVSKDVIPRYWTMKGYRVERRWGWDCHGLPIENIIEKQMGISGKKEIEKIGMAKFNEACRAKVLEYADVWDVMVRRIARWVDFENSYKTMDPDYMESVWWAFKRLWENGLVYQGRKVLLYCPRCETPISNFEVAMDNSYKEITEPSVYVKFKIKSAQAKAAVPENTYILAWTTTPWTLPGNVALAVGEDIKYTLVKANDEHYILAQEKLEEVMAGVNYEPVKNIKASDLAGLSYEPLFSVPALAESGKKVYTVAEADFVTTEDGTGVVHTAVVYGEDDYNFGIKLGLPVVPALDEKGFFNDTVAELTGVYFKKADKIIIKKLEERGLLFKRHDFAHSYPFCHRCETQLFYNAIPAWFLDIAKIREKLIEQNENINWYPEHLKEGRFKLGIEQAPDWNISRNRYFATPIPIWECDRCSAHEVFGSIAELEKKSQEKGIKDIHSHLIDKLAWPCSKCGGKMQRIPEVFDCWVESGSMSYAQHHYMGQEVNGFDPEAGKKYPAQYISEYISQTRAWFYVMHVISVALFGKNSFENVVTTGIILNEEGVKMSKSKMNYPDPWKVINEFGADALRMYLMSSSIMHAENLFFNERDLRDVFRKNIMILSNVYKFYTMFSGDRKLERGGKQPDSKNILDKWITALLNRLITELTNNMDAYDLPRSTRSISEFIDVLSTWYVRRSRDRFKGEDQEDREQAMGTLAFVLQKLAVVIAPFMPFMAEEIWQGITGNKFKDENKSVHLEAWPQAGEIDVKILGEMEAVRKIVELGLAKRDEKAIRVRQPLGKLSIINYHSPNEREQLLNDDLLTLIKDELNVKYVSVEKGSGDLRVELDTKITPELKQEGMKRELVRSINALRKQASLTINDRVDIYWQGGQETQEVVEKFKSEIVRETLASKLIQGLGEGIKNTKEVKVGDEVVMIGI